MPTPNFMWWSAPVPPAVPVPKAPQTLVELFRPDGSAVWAPPRPTVPKKAG
jgi:hypothetical protein